MSTLANIQIQCSTNTHQNPSKFLYRNEEQAGSKICMEMQKTLNSQNSSEKEVQIWRTHIPWLRSKNKQDTVVSV